MAVSNWNPSFIECVQSDEEMLKLKLASIRAAISHPGEKGTSVEYQIKEFIKSFLPGEYGISSGFIAYHENCIAGPDECLQYEPNKDKVSLSTQLDIIIYDALRFGPLLSLGSCDVFPLEAVYAYIEVKAKIEPGNMLRKLLAQSYKLRSMQTKFYVVPKDKTYTRTVLAGGPRMMSIRSFVVALDADECLRDHTSIGKKIESEIRNTNGFLSGMYIQSKGYFRSHHSETTDDPLNGTVETYPAEGALLNFKLSLLSALSRFPRINTNWVPAISTYYQPEAPVVFLTTGPLEGA